MQFKHPEILWALLLLLIPVIVHLFQLRRFKKTPFTNVKMLQKVVAESQKSKSLKKWLLLVTRLFLFSALILAFAQPFFANKSALQEKETVIYLDNSFSMQAKKGNTSLLENAIQEVLKNVPSDQKISLFTNNHTFKKTTFKAIQNDFLSLSYSADQLSSSEIELKAKTLFSKNQNTQKDLIVISDFQKQEDTGVFPESSNLQVHLVKQMADELLNVAIDSVYIQKEKGDSVEINVLLSTNEGLENTPIAIYDADKLMAKTAAVFDKNKKALVSFSLPANETILGRITLSDVGLDYDNQFYFTLNKKDKIKVFVIGEEATFLEKIYTDDEFEFESTALKNLNYSSIENQNLIVLNGLEAIPEPLIQALVSFSRNKGTITVIPNVTSNIDSYNSFLKNFNTTLGQFINFNQEITSINFNHPLYANVFDNKVTNFQYPSTTHYWLIKTKTSSILSFANGSPFLAGEKGFYMFSASLDREKSTFKNSPLIVPTFYKMGFESLEQQQLYTRIGTNMSLDIPVQLAKDAILKVAKNDFEFIPQQQPYANKVVLNFSENPKEDGNYQIKNKENIVKHISFNYPRTESDLIFIADNTLNGQTNQTSISTLFENLEKDNTIRELWKWFIILAVLFAFIEIGIQKYFK
ncbi:BatA domain-containing protein [Cellulophaga sp. Hel_I_12]|uniref:BatA domain-containing protein n=1 Tax=Cellulophaga sp. Hel_I_12 TaxID=1249972 RepID=UPI000645DA38|nr:BatA domain-containing protein [Cellulophaga sp. Hel_I_12]